MRQTTSELRAEVEALEAVLCRIQAIERTRPLTAEERAALREVVRQGEASAARRGEGR